MPRTRLRTDARRSTPTTTLLVAFTASFFASPALAHDQSYPIGADGVRVDTTGESPAFEYDSTDAIAIPFPANPAATGSAVLIRDDSGTLRTPLITLPAEGWSAKATGEYLYENQSVDRPGGVTRVRLTPDALEIDASGDGFTFDPDGPLDALWVHFRSEEEWYCTRFDDGTSVVSSNEAGLFEASGAVAPEFDACDAPVCGNGEHEIGEECDDGNLVDDDGCDTDCTIGVCNAETFDSTFEGIRKVIFEEEAYGCAQCHNNFFSQGGLSLVPDAQSPTPNEDIYAELLGPDGLGLASNANPLLPRIELSEPALSVLYLKLLKKRLEGLDPGYQGPEVGPGMPTTGQKLSEAHTEAIRRWIRAGAPLDQTVEGTAELLGTCLPPAEPAKVARPAAPAEGEGFQLEQTPWDLGGLTPGSNGEDEICMATYFDVSALAPEDAVVDCPGYLSYRRGCSDDTSQTCDTDDDCSGEATCVDVKNALNPERKCITYLAQKLIQDAQSHHSIIDLYTGGADTTDEGWGAWTYKFEPDHPDYAEKHGQPCDPTAVDPALGVNPGCSSEPISGIACAGFGPSDLTAFAALGGGGSNQVGLSGSQEPFYEQRFEPGVYRTMPTKAIVIWNSHAFNLTEFDTTMAQYLNTEFARGEESREHFAFGIFHARWIFAQYIQPFETQEICATYTLPKNANLFQLSSHTHVFGNKFRIWAPPNEPCQPGCPRTEDTGDPGSNLLRNIGICDEDDDMPICPGPREDDPIYFSTEYSDPLQLEFSPPVRLTSDDPDDRTYLYCSNYDNGSTDASPPVKRQSMSPPTPDIGLGDAVQRLVGPALGGPCPDSLVRCLGGDNHGALCDGDDAVCAPGGGVCDACPVHGGVTTMDEMFILLGSYYVADPVPEPASGALVVAALASVAALRSRRR